MNRKQRKERLKRLNAKRKEALKDPLNPEFTYKIKWFTTEELQVVLDHMYAAYAFDENPKLKARIEYVEKTLQIRKDRNWFRTPTNTLRIDPDSSKYKLC